MTKLVARNKLALKPGMRVLALNAPVDFGKLLAPLSPDVAIVRSGTTDAVVAFVKTQAEAGRVASRALAAIPRDGLLWFCYPKGGSGVATDLNRDVLWKELAGLGIRPVTIRSLGPVWSAMRFRPTELVKQRR
jgi:hypothetical protein